jgi:hypothetical protein
LNKPISLPRRKLAGIESYLADEWEDALSGFLHRNSVSDKVGDYIINCNLGHAAST